MNSQPSDQRLAYWRAVARAAEQDLQRLRDGIFEAIDQAGTDRHHPDDDTAVLDELIAELMRLANQPTDRRQRAQDAYNAVNDPTV